MLLLLHQSCFYIFNFTLLSIDTILVHYYKANLAKAYLAFVVESEENWLLHHCFNTSDNCFRGAPYKRSGDQVCWPRKSMPHANIF